MSGARYKLQVWRTAQAAVALAQQEVVAMQCCNFAAPVQEHQPPLPMPTGWICSVQALRLWRVCARADVYMDDHVYGTMKKEAGPCFASFHALHQPEQQGRET